MKNLALALEGPTQMKGPEPTERRAARFPKNKSAVKEMVENGISERPPFELIIGECGVHRQDVGNVLKVRTIIGQIVQGQQGQ